MSSPARPAPAKLDHAEYNPGSASTSIRNGDCQNSNSQNRETGGDEPNLTPRVEALQKWNDPNGNAYRMAAIFVSFLVMGSNDAAYGPLIPYVSNNFLDYQAQIEKF